MAFIALSTSFIDQVRYICFGCGDHLDLHVLISQKRENAGCNARHVPHAFSIDLQLGVVSVHFDPELFHITFELVKYAKRVHQPFCRKAEGDSVLPLYGGD